MAPSRTKPSTPRLSEAARHVVIPEGIVTTGWPSVEAKGAELGIRYDPWQTGAGRIALGKRADGKYAATVGGITWSIPRQVGKTFLVGSLLMILCVLFPGLKVIWTAHRTRTATNTFKAMQGMARRKLIAPHILHVRTANGEQEIAFRNGSVIMFGAREQGFGRGFDVVDVIVFDEAQILTEKALDDMVPATNQAQHPHGALLFYIGTPPKPTDPGEVFTNRRSKALAGKTKDAAYLEFSADEDADLDDRAQWRKANPSYPTRTPLESMLRMRENLGSDEAWRREALGIWDKEEAGGGALDVATWRSLADPDAERGRHVVFGVDIDEARAACVAVAWMRPDGAAQVMLTVDKNAAVDDALSAPDALERLRSLSATWGGPVAVGGPSSGLAEDLSAVGVPVVQVSAAQFAQACGRISDSLTAGTIRHGSQPALDASVASARWRSVGTSGERAWQLKDSPGIGPLAAATRALHVLWTQPTYDPLDSVR